MSEHPIYVTIVARDDVTPMLRYIGERLLPVVERMAFVIRNTLRRRPQGPRPQHHPRRRRGRA